MIVDISLKTTNVKISRIYTLGGKDVANMANPAQYQHYIYWEVNVLLILPFQQ